MKIHYGNSSGLLAQLANQASHPFYFSIARLVTWSLLFSRAISSQPYHFLALFVLQHLRLLCYSGEDVQFLCHYLRTSSLILGHLREAVIDLRVYLRRLELFVPLAVTFFYLILLAYSLLCFL